ncbi:two-component sensor histidine kinase [Helicobacter pullorum]|uniref:sensor histidine kinase n=1 Tax=Helicobacter pullorum TaxID=35818 RepID=UPI000816875A|nr:HAMP domain-containing sensor histidine kinase [Helicobacter pullorum]OCR04045.1 two-component sensor histidine kinase [Helicobacter pullorum]OCR08363.1 two-component sensor histidine kinase [Helicobacter pullorum]OCR10956.1 two-component sensor histidine kinase [Helicobacter pullorum]OCR13070.1 two-component sensor histidine kinase [Helicobacter pullorum]
MLSKRSIRGDYVRQITISFVALLVIFSVALYSYLYFTAYGNIKQELQKYSQHILANNITYTTNQSFYIQNTNILSNDTIKIVVLDEKITQEYYKKQTIKDDVYFSLFVPYKGNKTLNITKNITKEMWFLENLFEGIVLVNFFALILIQLFALAFSNILYKPIHNLSQTLEKVKEYDLETLNNNALPLEFQPLVYSINNLLQRIKNYLSSQKQLFIGIAHELKTPLAVMKTKCEVTLIKERQKEVYTDALKENISSINEMNAIIKMLLDLGRQESAQFEKSSMVDINKILKKIADNFMILSKKENKSFFVEIGEEEVLLTIKPTLLTQIVQNFLQNAFKFTPKGKSILLKSSVEDGKLNIVVMDEGCGIDSELNDIYAPFRRAGNKSGAGLGLFLAKNAANALGGNISLQNRSDKQGTIAKFQLKISDNWNKNC